MYPADLAHTKVCSFEKLRSPAIQVHILSAKASVSKPLIITVRRETTSYHIFYTCNISNMSAGADRPIRSVSGGISLLSLQPALITVVKRKHTFEIKNC